MKCVSYRIHVHLWEYSNLTNPTAAKEFKGLLWGEKKISHEWETFADWTFISIHSGQAKQMLLY